MEGAPLMLRFLRRVVAGMLRKNPPPRCELCASYKRVASGIEVCRRRPAQPTFCNEERKRPQAFGFCGVSGRYFAEKIYPPLEMVGGR